MRASPSLGLAALLALAGAGCGSIANPDKIKPVLASTVCTSIYNAILNRLEGCFKSPKDWIQATSPVPDCAGYDTAAVSGRMQVDTGKLDTCVNDIAAANCYDLFNGGLNLPGAACPVILLPQVPVGGVCYMNEECTTGTYCTDFLACPGTCRRFSGQGFACGGSGQAFCDPSLVCRTSGAAGATATTCELPLLTGADCTSAQNGCGPGNYCKFMGATALPAYTCQPQVGATSACQSQAACLVPFLCTGSATTTCQLPKAAAAACTVGNHECGYGDYCSGGAAGTAGTCVRYPSPPSGLNTCGVVNGEYVDCIGGWCNSGQCATYAPVGGSCNPSLTPDPNVQCGRLQMGYYCAGTGTAGTCASFICREP